MIAMIVFNLVNSSSGVLGKVKLWGSYFSNYIPTHEVQKEGENKNTPQTLGKRQEH